MLVHVLLNQRYVFGARHNTGHNRRPALRARQSASHGPGWHLHALSGCKDVMPALRMRYRVERREPHASCHRHRPFGESRQHTDDICTTVHISSL